MAISNLNKLFVRVAAGTNVSIDTIKASSLSDISKIYFVEDKNQIVNNGVIYGVDPSTAQSLKDLIAVVGQEKLGESGVDASSVVQRLAKLEAIKVHTASEAYLNVSDGTGLTSPEIGVKIQSLELVEDSDVVPMGLVDAVNAKRYIDTHIDASVKAAQDAATTVVETGNGLTLDTSTAADGHKIYTVSPDIELVYVAPVEGTPANLQLRSRDDASVFSTIQVSDIIGNGILQNSSYNKQTGELTLYFNNAGDTSTAHVINLADMLDINDMTIAEDSSIYLGVDLTGGENSQAVFSTKMQDPSTSDATHTGLADAYLVKQYVDSQTTDLAVDGLGDTYISAVQDDNNKKQIDVSANIATVTVTGGSAAARTIADDGTVTETAAAVAPTLSAEAGKLLDASTAMAAVKTYVDGKLAIEVQDRADADESLEKKMDTMDASLKAYIDSSIQALDASVDDDDAKNIHVGVTQVDGLVTGVVVDASYATVTFTPAVDETPATITISGSTGLVTGDDLGSLKDYVDSKSTALSVSAAGDAYVDASVDATDNKKINIATNIGNLTFTAGQAGADSTLEGDASTLIDASQAADAITDFVEARLDEEIAKLDSSITKSDASGYVTVQTVITDGSLNDTDSLVDVSVGNFDDKVYGLATVADVSTLVNTYNYWETYTVS